MKNELDDTWNIWYHSSKNSSWNNQSYKKILSMENLYDLKFFNDSININHLKTGMFFIMKNNIFPTWEDRENKNGCCISYKIYDNIVRDKFLYLSKIIMSEKFSVKNNTINGISIVPKKNYCIIKIWLKYNIRKNFKNMIKIPDKDFDNTTALIKKNIN